MLQVVTALAVTMQPAGQITADISSRAELSCQVSGGSGDAQRVWVKDGHAIGHSTSAQDVLVIPRVQREDSGMYQCLVRGEAGSAQASVQLVLGCKYRELIGKNFIKLVIL